MLKFTKSVRVWRRTPLEDLTAFPLSLAGLNGGTVRLRASGEEGGRVEKKKRR